MSRNRHHRTPPENVRRRTEPYKTPNPQSIVVNKEENLIPLVPPEEPEERTAMVAAPGLTGTESQWQEQEIIARERVLSADSDGPTVITAVPVEEEPPEEPTVITAVPVEEESPEEPTGITIPIETELVGEIENNSTIGISPALIETDRFAVSRPVFARRVRELVSVNIAVALVFLQGIFSQVKTLVHKTIDSMKAIQLSTKVGAFLSSIRLKLTKLSILVGTYLPKKKVDETVLLPLTPEEELLVAHDQRLISRLHEFVHNLFYSPAVTERKIGKRMKRLVDLFEKMPVLPTPEELAAEKVRQVLSEDPEPAPPGLAQILEGPVMRHSAHSVPACAFWDDSAGDAVDLEAAEPVVSAQIIPPVQLQPPVPIPFVATPPESRVFTRPVVVPVHRTPPAVPVLPVAPPVVSSGDSVESLASLWFSDSRAEHPVAVDLNAVLPATNEAVATSLNAVPCWVIWTIFGSVIFSAIFFGILSY